MLRLARYYHYFAVSVCVTTAEYTVEVDLDI